MLLVACQMSEPDVDNRPADSVPSRLNSSFISGDLNPRNIPSEYFAAFGTQWYVNIHNWRDGGLGKKRYFEPLSQDLAAFRRVGANVMRLQLNVDALLFWSECNWRSDSSYNIHNACYDRNYRLAAQSGWEKQIDDIIKGTRNPVMDEYIAAAIRLQANGFHVILAPSDFFWGGGTDWTNSTNDPLLHTFLERDSDFQNYYIHLINQLTARMGTAGLSNFSLQTLNEPRFCQNGRPNLRAWTNLERRIIDAARAAAPGLHIISSAVCTAADQYFANQRSYSSVGRFIPRHSASNISYAIHMRNPRLLHNADFFSFAPSTRLHYPFQALSESVGLNENTRNAIRVYNNIRPDADFYRRVFQDIATVAQRRGDRIIVTEWSVSKPDYGLPREDRVALFRDILEASASANVSIIYNGLLGRDGLSSSRDNISRPSHDFDPQLLERFAIANGR